MDEENDKNHNKDIRTMFEKTTNEIKFVEEKNKGGRPKGSLKEGSIRYHRKRKREVKIKENIKLLEDDVESEKDNDEKIEEKKLSTLKRNKLQRQKFMEQCMKKENMDVEAKSTTYHHMQWNWDACDEIIVDSYPICYKKLMRIRKYAIMTMIKIFKWPLVLIIWNIEYKRKLPRDELLHRDHYHIHAFLLFANTFEYCAERWRWEISKLFKDYSILEPDNISFHNKEHGIHYCATYVTKYTWLHEPIVDKIQKDFDYITFINSQMDLDAKADISNKVIFKDTNEFNEGGSSIVDQENVAIRGFDCLCYKLGLRWINVLEWSDARIQNKLGESFNKKNLGTTLWMKDGLIWNSVQILVQLNNEIKITHFIRKYGRILFKIIKNSNYCLIHFQKYQNNDDLIGIIEEEQYDKYDSCIEDEED